MTPYRDVQENMMKFFDRRGGYALRPDLTGPIARAAATKLFDPAGCSAPVLYFRMRLVSSTVELPEKRNSPRPGWN